MTLVTIDLGPKLTAALAAIDKWDIYSMPATHLDVLGKRYFHGYSYELDHETAERVLQAAQEERQRRENS